MSAPVFPRLTEAQVMAAVIQTCEIFGVEIERQNTGGVRNAAGQYVRFGRPGNADLTGMTGPAWGYRAGRKVDIECKREDFDPRKVRGKDLLRWRRQVERLRTTNENGGYGFWTDHPANAFKILRALRDGGRRVEIDDDGELWFPVGGDG